MGEKAVTEPCGPALNAAEPLSRGQHGKQSIVRVEGVSDNIPSLRHAALRNNVLNGGERSPSDLLCCPYHSPHIPPVRGFAASTPYRGAVGQDALYGAPVECSEDGRGLSSSMISAAVFTNQVRLSVMCTLRNLVLLTTTTAALLTRTGAWLGCFFLKSLHLLPVSQVVVIPDEAHHCCVKLHNVVGRSPWDRVVSHQSEQQGPVLRVITLEVF